MKITDKNNYKIYFSGTIISKGEASKAGVALFFGLTGSVAFGLAFGIQNKLAISKIALH